MNKYLVMLNCSAEHKVCIMENDFCHPLFFVGFYVGLIRHKNPTAAKQRSLKWNYFRRGKNTRFSEFP